MGSVGRGENRAIFKLQEIGSEFRETMVKTHRFQQDRCESQGEFVMIEKKNRTVVKESAVVVSPDRLQLAEKESGFVERVAVRVAEEKAVIFCGREEVKAAEGCGEGECGGGECRSSLTCREGKWVRREGCSEGCRGEGFFEDEKKIRQPSGVEKKRR
ncbi:hypothetical protein DKX38_008041 [Salix brachista]|uniref:Uncharacterized protein n=1 Tax=Salix brachista TaxID=2182728 RepID=A0A5N5MPZ8_9ROSI|nr:hypothetical protein DKX38_008041 [Salix brachista]